MEFINKFLTSGILLFLLEQIDVSKACSSHKDCKTCTSNTKTIFWTKQPCYWCPLTNSCHTKGSFYNECTSSQYIQSTSKCGSNEGKNYKYDANEAYNLALFSSVAYSNDPSKCLSGFFPNSDYNITSVLLRDCDDYFLNYAEQCMAFVTTSEQNKEVIVAFRGSLEKKQVYEQMFTALLVQSVTTPVGGEVQSYFGNVYKKFYFLLKKSITDLRNSHPDYQVKMTGHSLGGAVASITSAMLVKENIVKSEDISLYTFGMPKVGNKDYAIAFDKLVPNSWRVVRQGDIIATLPTCIHLFCSATNGPFHHGNKVIYTGDKMTKNSAYFVCDGNQDSLSECTKIEQQEASAIRRRRKRGSALDWFTLHTEFFGNRLGLSCLSV